MEGLKGCGSIHGGVVDGEGKKFGGGFQAFQAGLDEKATLSMSTVAEL